MHKKTKYTDAIIYNQRCIILSKESKVARPTTLADLLYLNTSGFP